MPPRKPATGKAVCGPPREDLRGLARRISTTTGAVKFRLHKYGILQGKDGLYDAADFMRRYRADEERAEMQNSPKRLDAATRKLEAETKLLEMKIAEREGVLVEAEAMTAAVCKQITAAKNDLLAIGRRVAPECVGGTAGQIEAAINRAVRDALRHVAEYAPE